jgi:hypothetical protein
MKIREALIGVFAAIASALASVAVFNKALKPDKPPTTVPSAGSSAGGSTPATEKRNPTGFLPKKEQPPEQKPTARVGLNDDHRPQPGPIPPGWNEPEPKEIPRPTYWPIVMSVAITFIFWGIVTSLIITGVGIVLFAVSLAGWIGDVRDEHENAHD